MWISVRIGHDAQNLHMRAADLRNQTPPKIFRGDHLQNAIGRLGANSWATMKNPKTERDDCNDYNDTDSQKFLAHVLIVIFVIPKISRME